MFNLGAPSGDAHGFNPFRFAFQVFDSIVGLASALLDILTFQFDIGDWTFSLWQLLGGIGLTAIIIAKLIKALIPVA